MRYCDSEVLRLDENGLQTYCCYLFFEVRHPCVKKKYQEVVIVGHKRSFQNKVKIDGEKQKRKFLNLYSFYKGTTNRFHLRVGKETTKTEIANKMSIKIRNVYGCTLRTANL